MSKPNIAQKGSYVVEVQEGKKYFWCACGLSQKQPFVMVLINQLGFLVFLTLLKQPKKFIFVDASIAIKNHFVMEHTIGSKTNLFYA